MKKGKYLYVTLLFAGAHMGRAQELWESASMITQWQSLYPVYVERWAILEITLEGPKRGNPFREVELAAVFKFNEDSISVDGFYDGGGVYKIRFMPQRIGEYRFVTYSNAPALNGVQGKFFCYPASPGNHGPVRVSEAGTFIYADGTPYYPMGTTAFAWIHQPENKQEATLASLAASPFNRLRMTVLPMHYLYTTNEPTLYPFPRSRKGKNEFSRFSPRFFRQLERRLANLANLGIEADLILFHPWDRWGYAEMDKSTDDFYLRYLTARLAAFRNIWWTVAAEYDLMDRKGEEDWDRFFEILHEKDPYGHLRTIHNRRQLYDFTKPWITHCSVQGISWDELPSFMATVKKPVLLDEQAYEGNLIPSWGRYSAQEIVRRFWIAALNGAFYTHGETIKDPWHEWIWWNKGGTLHGESPARLAFLQQILQRAPRWGWRKTAPDAAAAGEEFLLYYFGDAKPSQKSLDLSPLREYHVELIDTWNMTVEPLGRFSGSVELQLPAKPHLALLLRQVGLVFPAEPVELLYNGNLFLQQAVVELRHPRFSEIRYTLNGGEPNESSPRYEAPIVIRKDSTLLSAVAFSADGRKSRPISRLFRQVTPIPGQQLKSPKRGMLYQFYLGLWETLPDFSDLKPQTIGSAETISLSYAEQSDAYALVFEGYLRVPAGDIYTFSLLSDDGSRLYISGKLVVENDGRHPPRRRSGQIGLAAGYHPFRIEYFEAGGEEILQVYWASSTSKEELLMEENLYTIRK